MADRHSHLAEELERRLLVIADEWSGSPVPPLQRADVVALALIVAMAVLLGVIAGVSG
jgi:hypothetical protein